MSLDFNYTNVANAEEVMLDEDGNMKPVSEALVFATMVTGINVIKTDNWKEFYVRVNAFEKLHGPYIRMGDGSERPITPEDVHKHIGLRTNATTRTRTQFLRDVVGLALDDKKRTAGL